MEITPGSALRMLAASLLLTLLTAAAALAFSFGKYEKVKPVNGAVSIPVARLSDSNARFFMFDDGGRGIAFFAVKASDGSIRAAFDACDSCYAAKKGYEQQGDRMRCKNCNQKFAINRLGPNATGGCNPGYLPARVVGGSLIIQTDDLKKGARYF